MKVVLFEDASRSEWNTIVDNSAEAWLYHRAEWVELEASVFINESFMVVSDEQQPLGVFVVYRSNPGHWWRFGTQSLFTSWGGGPATAQGLSEKQRDMVMVFALDYLKGRAHDCKASHLEVRLPSLAPAYLPPTRTEVNPLLQFGFSAMPKVGSTIGFERLKGVSTPTVIVGLHGKNDDQLFADCSHDCRNIIRKADRAGVTCVRDDGPEGLKAFYDTYFASRIRSATPGRPFDFFQTMHNLLSGIGCTRVFHAQHEGRTVASALLLSYKDGVTYAAGGSTDNARRLSANNLLILETIKWAKREGKKWYETGLYFPYLQTDAKLAKIGEFKREFGGRDFIVFDGHCIYSWTRYLEGVLLEETYVLRKRLQHRMRAQMRLLAQGRP